MKKYLITGYSGFVSRHFLEFSHSSYKNIRLDFEKIDLLDQDRVESIIFNFQPDYIVHLASYSSVAFSWKEPILSFRNNMNIYLNLLESIRKLNQPARILSIGSSEEYGNVDEKSLPLTEAHIPRPVSPYAVARVSQEMISKVYVDGYGLDIIMTRSFNHIGPFQKDIFVISSFAKQLVEIKKSGNSSGELVTGDTSIVRDFTDVRDVVVAYDLLLKRGKTGEIYNVCSGNGKSLGDVIDIMAKILDINIHVRVNEKLVRPSDNKTIIGSNEKIKKEIGWDMRIPLEQSLSDIIGYWQKYELERGDNHHGHG
jgi:GDP-4-dehydro-6-deoxy-D-mannose reductase